MSETTACPYCGERVLAVAIKCKHCGSAIGPMTTAVADSAAHKASEAPAAVPAKKQPMIRPAFMVMLVVILAVVGGVVAYNWTRTGALSGTGFSDESVASIESDIRAQYSKDRGVTVKEVFMMRESPRKLTGFAKVRVPLLGEITKVCTATMGDDGRSIWRCQ